MAAVLEESHRGKQAKRACLKGESVLALGASILQLDGGGQANERATSRAFSPRSLDLLLARDGHGKALDEGALANALRSHLPVT